MMEGRRICKHCGRSSPDDCRFCEACGNPLSRGCPACGFETVPGARFCGGCGLQLAAAEPHLSDPLGELAGRLNQRPVDPPGARVQGEHKWVSVLFADTRGSLGLIEQLDAEAACMMLDGAIEIMVEAIQRHGGTINRVMGDGVMALFGAPLAQESHAVRACHAALAILSRIEDHTKLIWLRHGVELEVRIGISSGPVMVRTVRGVSIPYDVVGTTAHLASRMEQLARPGTIWLSEETARLAKGFFDLDPIGPVPVRGLKKPVGVFELRRDLPVHSAFDLALARGLSAFVGRGDEMSRLELALDRANAGAGQWLAVVGEPGIGKTRLSHEFIERAKRRHPLLLKTAPAGYGMAAPWQKLGGMLRRLFGIDLGAAGELAAARLHEQLEVLGSDLLQHEMPLLASLDLLASDERVWRELEPKTRRDRIQKAFLALFDRLCRDRLLVMVVEDLHDSDAQSIETLGMICRQLATKRIMLLVTYRPHFEERWPLEDAERRLRLGPLGQEDLQQLLDDLLGLDPELDAVKDHLVARAEGNPFFVEEMILQLADSGVLAGEPRNYRQAAHTVPEHLLPPTVQAVIEARIDRLDFEDKRLLRTAAVLGETVDPVLLRAIADVPDETLEQGLTRLCTLEFLQSAAAGQKLRFRHALLCEIAYLTLPGWQRRTIHQRIVETLSQSQVPSNERSAALADHALGADLHALAYEFAMELAGRAMEQSASLDAIAACGKAERALAGMADAPDLAAKTLELRFTQIDAHFASGNHARVTAQIEEAYALAERQGSPSQLVRASSLKAFGCWLRGDMNEAILAGARARSVADERGTLDLQINTAVRLGIYLLARGDYRATQEPFESAIRAIPATRIHEGFGLLAGAAAVARSALARALAELYAFERARALALEALDLGGHSGHPFTVVYVAQEVGILYLRTGEFPTAERVLSAGYEVAKEMPPSVLRPAVVSELGAAVIEMGRITEGLDLLEEAMAFARSLKLIPQYGQQLGNLARGRFLAGDERAAKALAEEALQHTIRYGERGDEAWIRFLLAEIAEREAPATAGQHFAELGRLAHRCGLLTLEQRCRERCSSRSFTASRVAQKTRTGSSTILSNLL